MIHKTYLVLPHKRSLVWPHKTCVVWEHNTCLVWPHYRHVLDTESNVDLAVAVGAASATGYARGELQPLVPSLHTHENTLRKVITDNTSFNIIHFSELQAARLHVIQQMQVDAFYQHDSNIKIVM